MSGDPAPSARPVAGLRLWSGLLLAPLAFATQVIASYAIAADGCAAGSGPRGLLIAVNLAALVAILAGLALSLANARAVRDDDAPGRTSLHEVGEGRSLFLVEFGLWMAALFAAATLFQLSALLMLNICVGFAPSV